MRQPSHIMGVLNVTPDSFSDGGAHLDPVARALQMVEEGADSIDVGGESTRPGADPVSEQEELSRVLPVIEALRRRSSVKISIDTTKTAVALAAVQAGASIVNDVSGVAFSPKDFPDRTTFLIMHRRGTPKEMAHLTEYPQGVVAEVKAFLTERVRVLENAGVAVANIWIDPGIGFAKRAEQSFLVLQALREFVGVGGRLAIGTSRKSFLGQSLTAAEREPGTLASNLWAYSQGASVFRVHSVAAFRRALTAWEAIENAC